MAKRGKEETTKQSFMGFTIIPNIVHSRILWDKNKISKLLDLKQGITLVLTKLSIWLVE